MAKIKKLDVSKVLGIWRKLPSYFCQNFALSHADSHAISDKKQATEKGGKTRKRSIHIMLSLELSKRDCSWDT
jgi:hypothetical protein